MSGTTKDMKAMYVQEFFEQVATGLGHDAPRSHYDELVIER
jgi:hypothetical protein